MNFINFQLFNNKSSTDYRIKLFYYSQNYKWRLVSHSNILKYQFYFIIGISKLFRTSKLYEILFSRSRDSIKLKTHGGKLVMVINNNINKTKLLRRNKGEILKI